jgi:putative MATE family efflux protein
VQDLTQGSISRHLVMLALPIGIGMVFQTAYYLVDLYFVAQIGEAAIAGVGSAGNVQFLVMALTQILGVGTMALISHASGRRDREDANVIFNQSVVLAALCALGVLVGGYALTGRYMATLGADAETTRAGTRYLYWFLPGLGLQFALVVMGSALRGTGIVRPTMIVQIVTVVVNALLAPVMIAGWITGRPFGVVGAGVSTSLSIGLGVALLAGYFVKLERFVVFDPRLLRPRLDTWKRILKIGLPPGGEFLLLFVYIGLIYWVIRQFGAEAQAGYGIGNRVMQSIFLPAMAVAFASAPLAGQNYGARAFDRVRGTFRAAAVQGSAIMILLTLFCQWRPDVLIGFFTPEPAVIDVGAEFLRIISWNFVAVSIVFTCSGLFQALGNTVPAVISSASRMLTFAIPAVWMSTRPWFELRYVWYLSVVTMALQMLFSLWLLRGQLRKRLG